MNAQICIGGLTVAFGAQHLPTTADVEGFVARVGIHLPSSDYELRCKCPPTLDGSRMA